MSNDLDKPQDGMPTVRWDDDTGATSPVSLDFNTGIGVGQHSTSAEFHHRQQSKINRHVTRTMNTFPKPYAQTEAERVQEILKQQEYLKRFEQQKRNVLIEKVALVMLQGLIVADRGYSPKHIWQDAADFVASRPEEFAHD
jgi:hypothetical protein